MVSDGVRFLTTMLPLKMLELSKPLHSLVQEFDMQVCCTQSSQRCGGYVFCGGVG